MKKNVLTRTMAVLASMTVLGAASMMSASAGDQNALGVSSATVTELGVETVELTIDCESVNDDAAGYTATITWDEALEFVGVAGAGSAVATPSEVTGNSVDVTTFTTGAIVGASATLTFKLPADYANGDSWTVDLACDEKYGAADPYETFSVYSGTITVDIPEAPTDAPTEAPTDAPTDAATEAPVTTAAPKATTVKKSDSPKTGATGIALAAAGLVTAGAAAVVLKKKH